MSDLMHKIAHVIEYAPMDGDDDPLNAADVVVDVITTFLNQQNAGFDGALTPAINLLSLEAEIERARRET